VKPDKGAFIRAVVYSLALLYLFLDLFFFQGPLYHKVRGNDPSSKDAIAAETARGVAARVYYQPILLTQIDRAVEKRLWRQGKSPSGLRGEDLKSQRLVALDGLFDEHLLRLKVRFNHDELTLGEDVIAESVRRFKTRFANEKLLEGAIVNQAWEGEEELIARVQAKLEQENYLEQYVAVDVPDDELRDYYETYRHRFTLPERIRARHIFYADLQHPDGEARELAQKALADLEMGADFAALARERSDDLASGPKGGDLNWMTRDRLSYDFSEQVFALPEGEPTVVQTLLGAHIVEVTARKAARERSFGEVRDELMVALSNQRREEGVRQYLKQLRYRDRHKLEVFKEVLERPWSL
jgi:hypothetical protein